MVWMHPRGEYFVDGTCAEGSFAVHVFLAGAGIELYHAYAGGFLSSVVLLFHEQVQAVEAVAIAAIFLSIVSKRFSQAYHCNATFVLECIH